jgi:glycosyltransferase involved in cell wall biosynthesis
MRRFYVKIAIVSPQFYPTKGGEESYTFNLASGLSSFKADTYIITSDKHYKDKQRAVLNKAKIVHITSKKIGKATFPTFSLVRRLRELNPDIVHVNGPGPYSMVTGVICKLLRIPSVLTYHADFNPSYILGKLYVKTERRLLQLIFDMTIVTNENQQRKLCRYFDKSKIKIIPLAADQRFYDVKVNKMEARKRIGLPFRKKLVLFVGRLDRRHYYKGVDVLIESAKLLPLDAHIVVVGDGDFTPYFKQLTVEAQVVNKVSFAGSISDELLPFYYRASDVFVLPSTLNSEGFGLVLFEAMASGVPVVTTDVVATSELIKKFNAGLVVSANDERELSAAVTKILENKRLYERLIAGGRRCVSQFSWAETCRKTFDVYRALLEKTD